MDWFSTLSPVTWSSDYLEWNSCLLDFCVAQSEDDPDGRFYLNIREMLSEESDEAQAEESFRAVVAAMYKSLLSVSADPIRQMRSASDQKGRPLCAAFLGLSVLAAERMRDNAYYATLCQTLELPEQDGHLPPGFVKGSFESAWLGTLSVWLRAQGFCLPPPPPSRQHFVQLPKMHALLRAGDLSKLPSFFLRCRYQPTNLYSEDRLIADFDGWVNSPHSNITMTGRTAWQDSTRRPGIINQIIRVLERWDGSAPEFSRYSAVQRVYANLHLDLKPERVLFRARRKLGFPHAFPFAGGNLVAIDEEWYRDLPVPREFGSRLQLPYESTVGSCRIALRGASVFAFVSEGVGMGYDQAECLVLQEKCAVLCTTPMADTVQTYLKRITSDDLVRRDLVTLSGWSLIAGFSPERESSVPNGIRALEVQKKLYPRFLGGLRIGHEQTWIAEAPPARLEAAGGQADHAIINGEVAKLREDRYLELDGWIREAGSYNIVLGARRIICVTPGRLNTVLGIGLALASNEDAEFALAEMKTRDSSSGWLFIGSVPGQICASFAAPSFVPQWRLGYQDGLPSIIALTDAVTSPQSVRRYTRSLRLWQETVLRFADGRLGATALKITPSETRQAWKDYVRLACILRAQQCVYRTYNDRLR